MLILRTTSPAPEFLTMRILAIIAMLVWILLWSMHTYACTHCLTPIFY